MIFLISEFIFDHFYNWKRFYREKSDFGLIFDCNNLSIAPLN
jgi:hypothetical protein